MEEQTNEFAINTRNVVQLLKEQCNKFSIEQLVEFRERLETTLIIHQKVYEKFHPLRWRYFRQKYLESFPVKWRKEKNKVNVFNPIFFMHDTLRTKRIAIDSLTDDEKIQVVAPLRENTSIVEQRPAIKITVASKSDIHRNLSPLQNPLLIKIKKGTAFELFKVLKSHKTLIFEDLSSQERQEILDKISPPQNPVSLNDIDGLSSVIGNRKLINRYNDNDPYDWSRWEYDLYLIDANCELNKDKDQDNFRYFFACQLALTDYFEIESFLQEQFEYSFLGEIEVFKKFIKMLFMDNDDKLTDSNIKEIVFEYMDNLKEIENVKINMIEKNIDISTTTKKLGRKPSEKISLPIRELRKPRDKRTIFGKDDTAKLFTLLAQLGCIFNENEGIAKSSVAGAIQVLTGFSADKIEEFLNYDLSPPKNEKDKIKLIEAIKSLITRAL